MLRARMAVDLVCLDESLTRQSFAGECDVNQIMERAVRGQVDIPAGGRGLYCDVSQVGDYRDVHDRMVAARLKATVLFDGLPLSVRREFHEDAEAFARWVGEEASPAEIAAVFGSARVRVRGEVSEEVRSDGGSGGGNKGGGSHRGGDGGPVGGGKDAAAAVETSSEVKAGTGGQPVGESPS